MIFMVFQLYLANYYLILFLFSVRFILHFLAYPGKPHHIVNIYIYTNIYIVHILVNQNICKEMQKLMFTAYFLGSSLEIRAAINHVIFTDYKRVKNLN